MLDRYRYYYFIVKIRCHGKEAILEPLCYNEVQISLPGVRMSTAPIFCGMHFSTSLLEADLRRDHHPGCAQADALSAHRLKPGPSRRLLGVLTSTSEPAVLPPLESLSREFQEALHGPVRPFLLPP